MDPYFDYTKLETDGRSFDYFISADGVGTSLGIAFVSAQKRGGVYFSEDPSHHDARFNQTSRHAEKHTSQPDKWPTQRSRRVVHSVTEKDNKLISSIVALCLVY